MNIEHMQIEHRTNATQFFEKKKTKNENQRKAYNIFVLRNEKTRRKNNHDNSGIGNK